MDDPKTAPEAPRPPREQKLDDILIARILMAGIAFALTLLALYASHLVLVSLLGLGKLKAAVAIPVVIGWFLPSVIAPVIPARAALIEGTARLDRAMFRRYLWRESATLVVAVGVGVAGLAFGSPMPMRSEVESVHLDGKDATLVFRKELAGPPPFLSGLTISLSIVALGTAFAALRGAHKAWQVKDLVNATPPDESSARGDD
jgi:hypothetical protein